MLVIKQTVGTTLVVGGQSVRIVPQQAPAGEGHYRRARVYVACQAIGELAAGSVLYVGAARLLVECVAATGSVRWAIDAPREIEVYRRKLQGAA